jgi:hypothetical protein
MTTINEHEWRGSVIATIKSLNHNDNILNDSIENIEKECNKRCNHLNNYQMLMENRMTSMEIKLETLIHNNKNLISLLIGTTIVAIGSFLTVLFSIILG